jgi:hypothetical protein
MKINSIHLSPKFVGELWLLYIDQRINNEDDESSEYYFEILNDMLFDYTISDLISLSNSLLEYSKNVTSFIDTKSHQEKLSKYIYNRQNK